jgi:hypothetical protein
MNAVASGKGLARKQLPKKNLNNPVEVTLTLKPERTATYRVVDFDGNPIAGVSGWLSWQNRNEYGSAYAAAGGDGLLTFHGVPADAPLSWLTLDHGRYVRIQQYKPTWGNKESPVLFTMQKGCSVSGRVVDESGRGVGLALVERRLSDMSSTDTRFTDDDGNFAFENLAAGKFKLVVQPRRHALAWADVDATQNQAVKELKVVVSSGGFIEGKVLAPTENRSRTPAYEPFPVRRMAKIPGTNV